VLRGSGVLKNALGFVVSVLVAVGCWSSAHAEDARATKLNQNTVGLLASQPNLLGQALEIAKSVDHIDGLRVLPIIGRGELQTINDLLFLRNVDVAMVSSDTLAFVQKNGLYADETSKVAYLAKLANENVIILARPEFTTLKSLDGKRIAIGSSESDAFVAADMIFGGSGMSYEGVGIEGEAALKGLRDKSIDAIVFAGADACPQLARVDAKSGFHIVPVSVDGELTTTYSPAILSHADFPNLLSPDETVETAASALVLAVYEWPERSERFYKLSRFTTALTTNYFSVVSNVQATNFSASVPGWKTYVTLKATRAKSQRNPLSVTALQ
jgi:TRAP-type uncharacterized transport system substrate-binding protein